MNNFQQPAQGQQIQVKINDEIMKGTYINNMLVSHTKEEFVLDMMNIFNFQGIVNARIITSPGHFKRMISAMSDNLKKYEERFGAVTEAENLDKEIGFKG